MSRDPFIYVDDGVYDGDNIKYLPTKWAICPSCLGDGTRRLLSEDYVAEMDSEELQDFFDGKYDTVCDECKGTGKIKVLDEDRCSPEDLAEYRSQEEQRLADAYEAAAERRMGA